MVFDGAVNAHEVVPGLVRMGRREWITAEGWRQARDAGYRTVVDLRSPFEHEIRRVGDAEVPAEAMTHIAVLSHPTEDPDDPGFDYPLGYLDHPADYPGYLELFGERVVRAVLAVAHADGPVIVHCSAGRDRTGLVLALGQLVAGWNHDDIVAGYLEAAASINAFHEHHFHPTDTHKTGAQWDAWVGERVAALRVFLREADAEALLRLHGATDGDLTAVRSRFAQPSPAQG